MQTKTFASASNIGTKHSPMTMEDPIDRSLLKTRTSRQSKDKTDGKKEKEEPIKNTKRRTNQKQTQNKNVAHWSRAHSIGIGNRDWTSIGGRG